MKDKSFLLGVFAGGLVCAAWLVAVSGSPRSGDGYQVEISNFNFAPGTLTVPAGSKVTWANRDDAPHRIESVDKSFPASPALDTGDRYSYTFGKPGTYAYFCSLHPKMTGKITVR